jgi:hypothetical protein
MKDVEVLLRGFAMLVDGVNYAPSMTKFLNQFSRKCRAHEAAQNEYLENLFLGFLSGCESLPSDVLINKRTKRFNIALFEAVFTAACAERLDRREVPAGKLSHGEIEQLDADPGFLEAAQKATTQTANVQERLKRARSIVRPL